MRGAARASAHADEILDELRAKEISFDADTAVEVTMKPNFPVAGPRLGPKIKDVAAALARGDYVERPDGAVDVEGVTLGADELIRTEKVILEGWVVAHEGAVSVAIDPALDDDLLLEGRALELIRSLNDHRKRAGLELTDRITVRLPESEAALLAVHGEWIGAEVLATRIDLEPGLTAPTLDKDGEYGA